MCDMILNSLFYSRLIFVICIMDIKVGGLDK